MSFPLLAIALLGMLILGGIVLVLVLLFASRGRRAPRLTAIPSLPPNREARVAILQQLADRRINVEEAEARLAALGNPVPAGLPPSLASSPGGRSCLIAGLVAMAVVVGSFIAVLLLARLTYSVSRSSGPIDSSEITYSTTTNVEESVSTEPEVTEETIENWEEETP